MMDEPWTTVILPWSYLRRTTTPLAPGFRQTVLSDSSHLVSHVEFFKDSVSHSSSALTLGELALVEEVR